MLGRGRADLHGGREMDEAVKGVDGRAAEHTGMLSLPPKHVLADFVDGRHAASDFLATLEVSEVIDRKTMAPSRYWFTQPISSGAITPACTWSYFGGRTKDCLSWSLAHKLSGDVGPFDSALCL